MEFNTNSKVLEKLLSKVYQAVPSRTPMAALENFLFEFEDGKLTVTATDLEIFLRSSMSIDSNENKRFTVPAKLLFEIVKALGDTTIYFTTEENSKLKIRTDNGVYEVGFTSADDYPVVPTINKDKFVTLNGKIIKKGIEQTKFAISKDAVRPAMIGTLLEFHPEGINFVATDGHRLVKYSQLFENLPINEQYILPLKAGEVLPKLLYETDVKIFLSDSNLTFQIGEIEFITRLIAQRYPDYKVVIMVENEKLLKIKLPEFQAAVRRITLFSSINYRQIKLIVTKDKIEISSEDIDHGASGKEVIPCDFTEEEMILGFNTDFLNDIISNLSCEEIVIKISSPTKAVLIEPVKQNENEDILMLLMPVRINS
ncbi:MAG: DNA polymerase III subunit beta [Chlorobiaceae bacterium]|nr:DNA polymerase III subunit beta [Chlorobiaceae bacterium]MBA4310080.1 DNA polymerase III subunit beta [Chlorobiaceae bacterium]